MSEIVQAHQPCEDCGSSDALARYDDGHTHCFSCGKTRGEGGEPPPPSGKKAKDLLPPGEATDLKSRRISEDTCKKFGYTLSEHNGRPVQIAAYRDANGALIGQKVRYPDKSFMTTGDFKEVVLFGQHLWRNGGKKLVITEGEIDALSYAEATDCKWPVVSIPNGAQGAAKAIKRCLEFVESYETVVLMFDMDEPGRKAAQECAALLTPGKAAIAQLALKDASEMLQAGKVRELSSAVWDAQVWRPDGIINGADIWEEVARPVEMGTPYPWVGLNRLLYGKRPSELVTWCAGSGIGKSAFTAEIAYNDAVALKLPVGYVALEESTGRTGLRFMGIHLDRPIHLPGVEVEGEERRRAFEATLGTGRFHLYDHFGSLDSEILMSRLRYMVVSLGIRHLYLDHLSIVVSGMDLDGDERRMLDKTMTDLRSFVQETNCNLQLVSHLKRPEGKGHEDGAMTSLSQLRGSAAIAQLSDAVIGLERNQQADDPKARNTTVLRVLKNRYAGTTGVACACRYDDETGRLIEVTDFDVNQQEEDGDRDF